MAAKRARVIHNYEQLNSVSSAILYDTAPRTKKAKTFYEVERIITRRRIRYDYEYLIKWQGWPHESCSWEPSTNLTQDLIINYNKPRVSDQRLQEACRQFCLGVGSCLRSRSTAPVYTNMDLDIWRFVTHERGEVSEHHGHKLFQRSELSRLKYLPENWWYYIDENGEGISVDFPLKCKPVLSWSPNTFIKKDSKLCKAARIPVEKICLTVIRKACNADHL